MTPTPFPVAASLIERERDALKAAAGADFPSGEEYEPALAELGEIAGRQVRLGAVVI